MALVNHVTNTLSERVIGAAIEVHRHLGPGLLESTYHRCLGQELGLRGLTAQSHVPVALVYKGVELPDSYVIDLLVESTIVVEVKAVEGLLPVHSAQLLTYMRLLNVSAGLLINFNVTTLVRGIRRRLL